MGVTRKVWLLSVGVCAVNMASFTLVEPARWEEIRRKVYLPQEADEYSSTSQPLAGTFTLYDRETKTKAWREIILSGGRE